MRHHLPVLATGVIGIGLWLLVAPATVGAPTESPEAVIHILALLGGPLLLGWAGAIWLSPRTFWPSLVMVVIPGPVVVMAGGEIVSRLTDNFGRNGWEVYENQEVYGPGATGVWRGVYGTPREYAVPIRKNELGIGFRGPMPGEKDDRTRIVFLGDSQTEARQVLLDSTYPRRLERMCLDVEAINLGESGVGQVEMLQHLRELGPRLEPDIVVASFLAHNDVSDNLPRLEQNRGEPKPDEWAETSARADAAPDTLWTEAWARTEAAFDSLALWSTRHDARFGVWFTPGRTHAQGRDERSVTELRMMAYLRAADIPVLPVARELLELPPDERLATAYTGDSHMTARGHAFVAERLAAWLAGLGWACDGIEGGTRQP